jgi:hypothetical protein
MPGKSACMFSRSLSILVSNEYSCIMIPQELRGFISIIGVGWRDGSAYFEVAILG